MRKKILGVNWDHHSRKKIIAKIRLLFLNGGSSTITRSCGALTMLQPVESKRLIILNLVCAANNKQQFTLSDK